MNTKSTHQIAVKAQDATGGAFASIRARAAATGARIRAAMGGALAAAGAYLGFRAISGTINELGHLSDIAMKSGMSVRELTQAATAFQVAGLNVSTESLTRSMQYLNKTTGRSGLGGFFDTVEEIAAIEDPAKRGAEAVTKLGGSGMEFQPLINGGEEVVQKFRTLCEIMPGVSDAAANAGDAVADAQTILGKGVAALWQDVIGHVCELWGEGFPGGVRAGAFLAVAWLEKFARKIYAWIADLSTRFLALGALVYDTFRVGPTAAWDIYQRTVTAAMSDSEARIDFAGKKYEDYKAKLKTLSVDDLAGAFGKSRGAAASPAEVAKSLPKISNDLILGGTNAAMKLAMMGPQVSEAKKQTELLKKIADNTEQTVDSIEDGEEIHIERLA